MKSSVYLDQASDEFVEAAYTASRRRRPRIDVTRSAVVRYALAQLAERMSAEQVADELRQQLPTGQSGPGRKRR